MGATQPPARCQRSKRAAARSRSRPRAVPAGGRSGRRSCRRLLGLGAAQHRDAELLLRHVWRVLADDLAPRTWRGCGRRATGSRRARARRAGRRGLRRAPPPAAGGRTRSRRRRGRAWAARRSAPAGRCSTSRAITTFCWFPPESDLAASRRARRRARRTPSAAARRARSRRLGSSQPNREFGGRSKSWSAMFSARVNSRTSPRRWRSSGMCPTPASRIAVRAGVVRSLPAIEKLPLSPCAGR